MRDMNLYTRARCISLAISIDCFAQIRPPESQTCPCLIESQSLETSIATVLEVEETYPTSLALCMIQGLNREVFHGALRRSSEHGVCGSSGDRF